MRRRIGAALVIAALLAAPVVSLAGDARPVTARAGEDLVRDAAAAWSEDARLVYVENDEPLTTDGHAARWGYLFYSPGLDAARAYSVRGGEIRVATDLDFDFEALPLPGAWLDSREALAAAEEKGRPFREKHGGEVRAMFLARGILHAEDPDAPTWAVVYGSGVTSGLWVVVDARSGKVVKTWRG